MNAFSLTNCELGVSTAATQIEGGDAPTNWHRWAEQPGHIKDGSSPRRANDHWNRVDTDVALLRELGVKHYRMGIEWARVEPAAAAFDPAAIEHYRDELGKLRDAGIKPLVTLHHFNNPLWFEDAGGFLHDEAPAIFCRYAERMVRDLGDLVEEWITINEPNIYATHGYFFGTWPPGVRSAKTMLRVYRTLAVAHIRAYRLIHDLQPAAKVGVAQHLRLFEPKRRLDPRHRAAATGMRWMFQGVLNKAMSKGRFLAPLVQPANIGPGKYYDFQGINYYSRSTVTRLADEYADDVAVNDLGWEIYPEGLIRIAEELNRDYPGPIYVTENGTADSADGFRSRFLYEHLRAIAGSRLPIERYYHWTFIDNWEWLEGESARFGLVHCDYPTQQRTIKDSGRFFADIAAHGGVTEDDYRRYVAGQVYGRNTKPR